ncbi:MAG: NAD(P)-dependent oxidoreductase [Candidatus Bathyarchaeia archaeon]
MKESSVGVVGLGAMGLPMARNLILKGFSVTVFDVREEPLKTLESFGARVAHSPREVAAASAIVLTSLPSSKQVEDVVMGENGLINGMSRGGIIVDTSTIDPAVSKRLAEECRKKGIAMIDAPVSGGTVGAEKGTLSIMVGGDKKDVDRCMNVLRAIGVNIYHVGDSGNGQLFKLINNMLVGINLVGVSEAFVVAKKAGIDLGLLHNVVRTSAGASWALEQKLPKMASDDFEPGFRVWLQHKDLALAMSLASQLGAALPMTSLAFQMYESAKAMGLQDLDHSAIVKVLQKLSGIECC